MKCETALDRLGVQVGGPAHTTWLQEALTAGGVTTPILGGIPKVLPPAAGSPGTTHGLDWGRPGGLTATGSFALPAWC